MSQKSKVWGLWKITYTIHNTPAWTPTAPPPGLSVTHWACASLGDTKPAGMANVSRQSIEKHKKIHINQTSSSSACKNQNLQNSDKCVVDNLQSIMDQDEAATIKPKGSW